MLIQISNRCDEGCPHCLQDSREDGGLMSLETFKSAVRFGCETGWHLFLITGGEPTMNPDMERMLRWFDDVSQKTKRETGVPIMFAIATNGTWMEDMKKRRMIWRVVRLKSYLFTQVYTNKRWYQDYDYIQDLRTELEQIPHCKVDEEHIWMQDLGRARTNADCQAEVEKNPYRCSCLNAALAAHQVRNPKDYGIQLESHTQMCSPCVDFNGDVHLSESWLCPSVGNVTTDTSDAIYSRMRQFRPCMRCKNSRRLFDNDPKLAVAREILGIRKED